MPIVLQKRNEVLASLLNETTDRIPDANTGEGEPYWILANIMATGIWSVLQPVAYAVRQFIPTSADTEFLERHGALRRISRKGANKAAGPVLIVGTNGSTQLVGSVLTDESGKSFTTTTTGTISTAAWATTLVSGFDPQYPDRFLVVSTAGMAIGDVFVLGGVNYVVRELPGGNEVIIYGPLQAQNPIGFAVDPAPGVVVQVSAAEAGTSSNQTIRAVLTLQSPSAGITATATALYVTGGAEVETDEEWALRMEDVDAEYPAGGNRSQILGWILGLSTKEERDRNAQKLYALGVVRGYVYPLFRGLGTGDAIPQGVARARHLSPAKRQAIQDYIAPATPTVNNPGMVAMGCDFMVTDFVDQPQDIVINVFGGPDYPPDWDTTAFLVQAGSSTVRINTNTNPIGIVSAGSRFTAFINNLPVVGNVSSVDALGFNVNPPLPSTPATGSEIRTGSALIEPIRDALLKMFDLFGPGDTVPPTRFPAPDTINPTDLTLSLIHATVMSVFGVKGITILTPGANVVPAQKVQVVPGSIRIYHLP